MLNEVSLNRNTQKTRWCIDHLKNTCRILPLDFPRSSHLVFTNSVFAVTIERKYREQGESALFLSEDVVKYRVVSFLPGHLAVQYSS